MARRHALRDDQGARIEILHRGRAGTVGATARNNRLVVEAAPYRHRAGIPWRDLPERFGHFRVAHRRFGRWAWSGVGARVFEHSAQDADNEYAMIDATIVRASAQRRRARKDGEDQAIGRSKGGLSTKIRATVDALGNPTGIHLTPGQAHDLVGADAALPQPKADALRADKAYDADERVLEPPRDAGIEPVIPSKANRKEPRPYDKDLCKARSLIEIFYCKVSQFGAIARRCDESARNFLAAIRLAAAVHWLN